MIGYERKLWGSANSFLWYLEISPITIRRFLTVNVLPMRRNSMDEHGYFNMSMSNSACSCSFDVADVVVLGEMRKLLFMDLKIPYISRSRYGY